MWVKYMSVQFKREDWNGDAYWHIDGIANMDVESFPKKVNAVRKDRALKKSRI